MSQGIWCMLKFPRYFFLGDGWYPPYLALTPPQKISPPDLSLKKTRMVITSWGSLSWQLGWRKSLWWHLGWPPLWWQQMGATTSPKQAGPTTIPPRDTQLRAPSWTANMYPHAYITTWGITTPLRMKHLSNGTYQPHTLFIILTFVTRNYAPRRYSRSNQRRSAQSLLQCTKVTERWIQKKIQMWWLHLLA